MGYILNRHHFKNTISALLLIINEGGDYHNTLNKIEGIASRYVYIVEQLLKDHLFETLPKGHYKGHLGQFSAQSFDNVNEKIVRGVFFTNCAGDI